MIALEIKTLKDFYPDLSLISVCHSLIKMEHLTDLGSCYTSNYIDQEQPFNILTVCGFN